MSQVLLAMGLSRVGQQVWSGVGLEEWILSTSSMKSITWVKAVWRAEWQFSRTAMSCQSCQRWRLRRHRGEQQQVGGLPGCGGITGEDRGSPLLLSLSLPEEPRWSGGVGRGLPQLGQAG